VSVRLVPVACDGSLLVKAQVIEEMTWAPNGYVDERRCFRAYALRALGLPFNPCLGDGEDADLINRLKCLGFNPHFINANLGHCPPSTLGRFLRISPQVYMVWQDRC